MNKKVIVAGIIVLVAIIILAVAIAISNENSNASLNENVANKNNDIILNDNITNENNSLTNNKIVSKESEEKNKMIKIKAIINNNKYEVKLENNETVSKFLNLLPQEFNMNELNGNEKYTYLDTSLPTNSYNPKHIEAGDIMLFGNDCLVVFYKSFNTSYSYTRIGHIDNLADLGNKNIIIKFYK